MEYMVPFILAFELSLFGDDHSRDCHYKALKYIILIIFFFYIYLVKECSHLLAYGDLPMI